MQSCGELKSSNLHGRKMQGVPPNQGTPQQMVVGQSQQEVPSQGYMGQQGTTFQQPAVGQPQPGVGQPQQGFTTQQIMGGQVYEGGGVASPYGGPVVYAGPPSQAAKIIGILLMIYGGFSIAGGLLTAAGGGFLNSYMSSMGGSEMNELLTPTWVYVIQGVVGALTGAGYMYAGWLMQAFQKKGVWVAWGILGLAYLVSIVVTAITPYPSTPDMSDESLRLISVGTTAFCGLFGAAICGLILAIPLMVSNNGME